MKKRVLSMGMAMILAMSTLAGCSSGNATKDTAATTAAAAATTAAAAAETTAAPAAEASNVLYSNGGPQEFFETPWLNPGSFMYNKTLYDHLLVADNALSPKEGQLAATYEMSADGKTLKFTLRDNIFWHDGEAITADDIK
ncbi:MAG: ABC transporter substrate-binding protein, partial [Hungatella sp.]